VTQLRRLFSRPPGFDPRSGHVVFVVHKVARRVVFEYFVFSLQFSFHQLFHTHNLLSGAGTIGQRVDDVLMDSLSPHPKKLIPGLSIYRVPWCPEHVGQVMKQDKNFKHKHSFVERCAFSCR
jgi:hypothetical protein